MDIADDIPWGPCRLVYPSAQPMYAAARRWRDESLVGDRSLFDGRPIDGDAAFQELMQFYVNNPDAGAGTFVSKLRVQLADAGDDSIQVAAELLYVHALIAKTASWTARSKLELINTVASFGDDGVARVPADLAAVLAGGATNTGQAYGTFRWKMFGYLIKVFGSIKQLDVGGRRTALSSLQAFRDATASVDTQTVWAQQFALEHLLFPDVAPPILSQTDRQTIADAFSSAGSDIISVCSHLEPNVTYGAHSFVSPYASPYRRRWNPIEAEGVYAAWACRVAEVVDLDADERSYKLERVPHLRAALTTPPTAPTHAPRLKEALGNFNVVDYRVADTFLNWVQTDPDGAIRALRELQQDPGPESVDRFLAHVPVTAVPGMGARLSVASTLLMGFRPEAFPPWRETAAKTTQRLTGGHIPEVAATAGEIYLLFLERLDAIKDAVLATGGPSFLRDRLDTQGLAWTIASGDLHPENWSLSDLEDYNAWRLGKRSTSQPISQASAETAPAVPPENEPSSDEQSSLEELADHLFLDDQGISWLEETLDVLERKGQIILQGPPGTGKTYIGLAIARFVAESPDRVTTVQFHPGTSYEDFVQGLRPNPDNPARFTVVDGPLIKIAKQAHDHPDDTFVLLVDEINRGNIPAIFGELYFLLEYRGETVTLMYGGRQSLPKNLLIIGTMNTADRSITSLDSALRRRFYIRDLRPDQPPVDGSLRRLLQQRAPQLGWLADLLDRANSLIGDRDQYVGPSHFMGKEIDETWARRAWQYSVMPTLHELFYSRPERAEELEFDVLRAAMIGDDDALATD